MSESLMLLVGPRIKGAACELPFDHGALLPKLLEGTSNAIVVPGTSRKGPSLPMLVPFPMEM